MENLIQKVEMKLAHKEHNHKLASKKSSDHLKPLPAIANGDATTQWINALIGRWFLSVGKSAWMFDLIESKIRKKLVDIKRPSIMGPFSIRYIEVGESCPMIFNARLIRLDLSGNMVVLYANLSMIMLTIHE